MVRSPIFLAPVYISVKPIMIDQFNKANPDALLHCSYALHTSAEVALHFMNVCVSVCMKRYDTGEGTNHRI